MYAIWDVSGKNNNDENNIMQLSKPTSFIHCYIKKWNERNDYNWEGV